MELTPKQKSEELIEIMLHKVVGVPNEIAVIFQRETFIKKAIECAITAVNETISALNKVPKYATDGKFGHLKKYYKQVRIELNKHHEAKDL